MVLEKPLISVVMPAYNASQFIKEAIESVLAQTYPHFELLICDDGSVDSTIEIITSIKDSRIHLFKNRKNIGNLKTTNFLFSKCKGDLIAIQDADDISLSNRFELCVNEFLNDHKLGLIGTNYIVTDACLNPLYCGLLPLKNHELQEKLEKEVPPFLYASIIVKRELVDVVGGFRPLFNRKGYADLDWLCRICELTEVKNLKEISYFYRKYSNHENSPRNLIAKFGAELIVEAHKQRLNKGVDFIDMKDFVSIRKYIGEIYLKKGEQAIWEKKYRLAFKMLFKSLTVFPFNKLGIKIFLKLTFKLLGK